VSFPGGKAAARAGQWLLGKLVRHGVILGYHRVADGPDPYQMSVSPERFGEQLAMLARLARPMRLEELPTLLADARLPRRAVAVTFDDGYADTLHIAQPLLAQVGIPATVFVVSGAIGRELWWDRLDRLVTLASESGRAFTLPVGQSTFTWGERSRGSVASLRRAVYLELRPLEAPARDAALDRLSEVLAADEQQSSVGLRRVLTDAELHHLAASDLVRIGAHTVTHPPLSQLNPSRQREEIAGSRRALESLLGRPVTSFSYPFGDRAPGTAALVREAGYVCACQSRNAVVWRRTDRFALPRFWVPNWDGPRFGRWLRRWLDD
jgi:peptidoglycan/xylan/chitin deacetylase (PgdA/CDA1 family)